MADSICPTFSAGTLSVISTGTGGDVLNDSALAGQPNGTANQNTVTKTVGSFNYKWNNGCLSQNVQPVFRTSLVKFGDTGRQS